jgi:hypothetical protein
VTSLDEKMNNYIITTDKRCHSSINDFHCFKVANNDIYHNLVLTRSVGNTFSKQAAVRCFTACIRQVQ